MTCQQRNLSINSSWSIFEWFISWKRFLCSSWHNWRTTSLSHLLLRSDFYALFTSTKGNILHCQKHFTEFDGTWHNNLSSVMGKFNDPIYHSYQSFFTEAVVVKYWNLTKPITRRFSANSWNSKPEKKLERFSTIFHSLFMSVYFPEMLIFEVKEHRGIWKSVAAEGKCCYQGKIFRCVDEKLLSFEIFWNC